MIDKSSPGFRDATGLSPSEAFQGMLRYSVSNQQAAEVHGDRLHEAAANMRAYLGHTGLEVVSQPEDSSAGYFVHLAAQGKTPVGSETHDLNGHFVGAYCTTDALAGLIQRAANSVMDYCRYSYDPYASNKGFMGRLILCSELVDNTIGEISNYPFNVRKRLYRDDRTKFFLTSAACLLDSFAQQPDFHYDYHGRFRPVVDRCFIRSKTSAGREIAISKDHPALSNPSDTHRAIAIEQMQHIERMSNMEVVQ